MPPHETRLDSPVETPEELRGPCLHWTGTLRSWPLIQMRTSALTVTTEESQEAPSNYHGDWTFLRPQEGVPDVSPKLERNPRFAAPTCEKPGDGFSKSSMRNDALFGCGVSREIPPSLLSLQRVLDNFKATQEVRKHTRLHSRGTLRVLSQFKKSPGFPSSS